MQGNVFPGSWELPESSLSPVCSLCSLCLLPALFYHSFPHHQEVQICSMMYVAVSDIKCFKERFTDWWELSCSLFLLFWAESLVRVRKDSGNQKRVIQAQSNEILCSDRLSRRTPAVVLPCIGRRSDLVGVLCSAFSEENQPTQNLCSLKTL